MRRGFSLVELLVVIAIIVLLIGLLLVALGGVRDKARGADTLSTLNGISQAAQAYQLEHRTFPGLIPERLLESNPNKLTTTENAVLAMMGGARVLRPNPTAQEQAEFDGFGGDTITFGGGWQLKVNVNRIGEGPFIDGKPFAPYYTAAGRELAVVAGQVSTADVDIPEFIDSWGQPVLYARRLRSSGPLAGNAAAGGAQFTRAGFAGYLESNGLGELGANQDADDGIGSILTIGSNDDRDELFAQSLRHPAFGPPAEPLDPAAQPNGAIALLSAGPDGVYLARDDGPGSTNELIGEAISVADFLGFGPSVFKEFDDVRVFGGS